MELNANLKRQLFGMLLLSRRVDEKAWKLYRERKINFHISAIGHEAAQIGAGMALQKGVDWVTPYYRDFPLLFSLGFPVKAFFMNLYARAADPVSGGREMPGNWNFKEANVLSYSTLLATQVSHAVGIAMAARYRNENFVVLASSGEGATSQGEWYEAVNLAAVNKLPVIFFVQNNGYAISVPSDQQMAVESVVEKAQGLGVPGKTIDGRNLFNVYREMKRLVENVRSGSGPILVEMDVDRITPHSTDDDDRLYRQKEEVIQAWQNDPLETARRELEEEGLLSDSILEGMETKLDDIITKAVDEVSNSPVPDAEEAQRFVYYEEGIDD